MASFPNAHEAVLEDPAKYFNLTDVAAECICVCMRPEHRTTSLASLGFLEMVSEAGDVKAEHLRTRTWPSKGTAVIVLASRGGDEARLLNTCRALLDNETTPRMFVVLAPLQPGPGMQAFSLSSSCKGDDSAASVALQERLVQEGVDDVFNLEVGERLTSRRVRCAILRAEKVQQRLQKGMVMVQEECKREIRIADRRFLWGLIGHPLENIPAMDRSLDKLPMSDKTGSPFGVKDLVFASKLGAGSYGTVYKSSHPVRGPLAVKAIAKESVKDVKTLMHLDHEFGIMCSLSPHPNVARGWEALHGRSNLYLVMSYAGTRPLHDYQLHLTQTTGLSALPQVMADDFCRQECRAVAHLHANSICHRDLKPANFILSDDCRVLTLVDFGLAVPICGPGHLLNSVCGSLPFVAPEILELRTTGQRCDGLLADSWSLAVNLYELCCGPHSVEKQLGWVPRFPGSVEKKIRDLKAFGDKAKRTLPSNVESDLRDVIIGMLEVSPKARLPAGRVLEPGEEDA